MKAISPTTFLLKVNIPFAAAVAVAAWAIAPLHAATLYHVRPYTVITPAAITDGLIENGAKSNSLSFNDASQTARASANLATGELKAYAGITNTIAGAVALAEYSDTFEIRGGAGTTIDFDFAFDGEFEADAKSVGEQSTYQLYFTINFAVFEAGMADWDTWYDRAYTDNLALYSDTYFFDSSNPTGDQSEFFNDSFSYSASLDTNFERFQVFARIQLAVNASGSTQTAFFDFENTGTLGFTTDPSAQVFSESGVFPNTTPVPEPGSVMLAVLGASLLVGHRRVSRK